MEDIVIDNNVAKNFANPMDQDYKAFIKWLFNKGSLAVCSKLIREYNLTSQLCKSDTNICIILDYLTKRGRLNNISNDRLRLFNIPKRILKTLRSHAKDRFLIKIVLLSFRKLLITLETNLQFDINNYPGYSAIAVSSPCDIPYDS